jgi:hypothetical protein
MSAASIEHRCPYCREAMTIAKMSCPGCQVAIEGSFSDQPISRLPDEHQRFIEMFVLAGGSLKEIAAQTGVSYPTVRNRLDRIIQMLSHEIASRENPSSRKDSLEDSALTKPVRTKEKHDGSGHESK